MTNNQIDPNQDHNQLSDEELEAVAGGGVLGEVLDATKDFVGNVYEAGKDLVSDVGETIGKHL